MGLFQDLKLYARSGSLEFVLAKHASPDHSTSGEKKFNWRNHEVFYRPATSDQGAIYEILLRPPQKTEYFVDSRVRPQVILDIGANIGITTIWLKEQFANATIYAFEPMPENFRLLQKNTAKLANVHIFPFGLGSADMRADVYANEDRKNHGAFSIYARETDSENLGNTDKLADQIEIRNAGETLKKLDISQIDILKIDTEGAEFDIVSCLPENILKNCQWIMGELHGIRTYGVLNLLEPWFATQFKKTFTNELFTFFAMNRSLLKVNKPSISRSC